MRKIVFDIETKNTFQDVGTADPAMLDLSLIAIYDYTDDAYYSFLGEELPQLWPKLEKADMLIGFNSDHFDIPLLNKYYQGDLTNLKSLDLLKEVKKSLGRRIKLDDIAAATLQHKKIAHGLEAIKWWRQGEIEKIREYCIEDVRITKEVYDYALKNQKLKYQYGNEVREVSLDTSEWEENQQNSMTHTMPF